MSDLLRARRKKWPIEMLKEEQEIRGGKKATQDYISPTPGELLEKVFLADN